MTDTPEDDVRNGQRRPGAHTVSARIWAICDAIAEETGRPARQQEVLDQAAVEGFNPITVKTQHSKWCRYHAVPSSQRGLGRHLANGPKPTLRTECCPECGQVILTKREAAAPDHETADA